MTTKARQKQAAKRGLSDEKVDAFKAAVRALTIEFGIEDASFVGVDAAGNMIGCFISDCKDYETFFRAIVNVGRLWQHDRTLMRDYLNKYDGWGMSR